VDRAKEWLKRHATRRGPPGPAPGKGVDAGTGDYSSAGAGEGNWDNEPLSSPIHRTAHAGVDMGEDGDKPAVRSMTRIKGGKPAPTFPEDISWVCAESVGSPRLGAVLQRPLIGYVPSPKAVSLPEEGLTRTRSFRRWASASAFPPFRPGGRFPRPWGVDTWSSIPPTIAGASESDDKLHVVERLRAQARKCCSISVTIVTCHWTKPWTVRIPMRRSTDAIYEYGDTRQLRRRKS